MTAPSPKHAARAFALAIPLLLLLTACGGETDAPDAGAAAAAAPGTAVLTDDEIEQGIGPVRDLDLAAVDAALAEEGRVAFGTKCSGCHKVEERYVGPRLGTVLARRRPEFVMNMILNANEMVQRHPAVRELLAQFYTPMPVQVTEHAEARAILEYLRSVQMDTTTAAPATPAGAGGL
jgi:mono/diheme cytochrome c family protein